jgi:hypothetical protein
MTTLPTAAQMMDTSTYIKVSQWSPEKRERLRRLLNGEEKHEGPWFSDETIVAAASTEVSEYTLHFLLRDEYDPDTFYRDDEEDDEVGDEQLNEKELLVLAEINDIIDSLAHEDDHRLKLHGSATIFSQFRTIRNLCIWT